MATALKEELVETPVDKLVLAYRNIRDKLAEIENEHKERVSSLKEKQELISNALLDICAKQGSESIRTKHGTISRRIRTRFWVSDWEKMHEFIKEHDALYLLEQRVSTGNMQKFLEEYPDEYPVGLHRDDAYIVNVRKPTTKE